MEWEKLMLSIDELINCPEKYYAHRVNDVDKIETLKGIQNFVRNILSGLLKIKNWMT